MGTCVTPMKVTTVQQTLGSENEPHLCALQLLQSFFTTEELAIRNTNGTYGRKCLDSAKLILSMAEFLQNFQLATMRKKRSSGGQSKEK